MIYLYNDGGRKEAGYNGNAGDCVCRAVSIASGRPYKEVYEALSHGNANERRTNGKKSARNGIHTKRKWFDDYMQSLGFVWVPTMKIGSGCKVHLRSNELPEGRLVVSLSKHMAAVIGGVLHDTFDCSRAGTRCVYGYYVLQNNRGSAQ